MKAISILAIVMFALLIAAVSGLAWQSHKREQAEQSLTGTREELKQTGDVLTEVRALRHDVSRGSRTEETEPAAQHNRRAPT